MVAFARRVSAARVPVRMAELAVFMPMLMPMLMIVIVFVLMLARVVVGCARMDGERHAGPGSCRTLEMHVEIPDFKLGKFPLKTRRTDAQVGERAHQLISVDFGLTFDAKDTHAG